MRIERIISKIFGHPEEINGDDRCSTYLYRWILLRFGSFKAYLHKFVGDDWSRDLHDHPKRFISIGIYGSYVEETPGGTKIYSAPWIRSFPATHIHRISLLNQKPCWTVVIVLRAVREWGFWHEGEFIHWKSYVWGDKSHIADKMTACD